MDNRGQQHRPSSLPSSLIPHLFSGPQQPRYSQTRTTLQTEDLISALPHDRDSTTQPSPPQTATLPFEPHRHPFPPVEFASVDARDGNLDRRLPDPSSAPLHRVLDPPSSSFSHQYGSPIYADPNFHSTTQPPMPSRSHTYSLPPLNSPRSRQSFQPADAWREGEAGPSSLLRPASHDEFLRHRRGSHQPLSVEPRASAVYRSGSNPVFDHRSGIDEGLQHRGNRVTSLEHSWTGDYHSFETGRRLPGPSQLFEESSEKRSPSYEQIHERQDLLFPAVGSLSISARSPSYLSRRSSDAGSIQPSEARSTELASNDGEDSQKGKRRRGESVSETDDNAKKTRNPRKTAVACNFCRGRKLRCNGEKPSCYNCTIRKFECEYVPVQRRRGPGKAPKGSRSRKVGGRIDSKGGGDRPYVAVAEHELDSLAPEVRPYMSVLSLNSFGFQPPPSPQYPTTTRGSRETSSSEESDVEKE